MTLDTKYLEVPPGGIQKGVKAARKACRKVSQNVGMNSDRKISRKTGRKMQKAEKSGGYSLYRILCISSNISYSIVSEGDVQFLFTERCTVILYFLPP